MEVETETISSKILSASKLGGSSGIKMRKIPEEREKGIRNILALVMSEADISANVTILKKTVAELKK